VNAINAAGQVVGDYYDSSGFSHAFLYSDGTFINIEPAGARQSGAWIINDDGTVVGKYQDSSGVWLSQLLLQLSWRTART
jgi:probable HAF family extracellular repeat protein